MSSSSNNNNEDSFDIPDMMNALVKTKAELGYEWKQVPTPKVTKPDEVLIKIEKVSICGSDILLYRWYPREMAETIATIPFIPGHEGCGIVVAVGSEVKNLKVGDRVAPESHIPCEKCYQCTHDQAHICQDLLLYGHNLDGVCAEYCLAQEKAIYKLKTDLSASMASLLEPFGVAYRTVNLVKPKNDSLVVIGCGPIGSCAVGLASQCEEFKSKKIIALDITDSRLEIAKQMGADATLNTKDMSPEEIHEKILEILNEEDLGIGIGCIIEASGSPAMVNSCTSWLRKGGDVVFCGLPKAPIHIESPLPNFIFKELTIHTLHGRLQWSTWENLEEILFNKRLDVSPIVTHEFDLENIDQAFQAIFDGEACKVQLNVWSGDQ